MTRRLRTISTRIISSGAIALALTALLTSLVHMGAVRHERCAEHGELVEVLGPSVVHQQEPLAASAVTAVDGSADGTEDHDHCLLATMTALPSQPAMLERATCVPAPCVTGAEAFLVLIAGDVLGFAPKTSPPALA